jgi:hypothetical protein
MVRLGRVAEARENLEPDENDVEDRRPQERREAVDDLVVVGDPSVQVEGRGVRDQRHREDQTEVVRSWKLDETREHDRRGRGRQPDRGRAPEQPEGDCPHDEGNPEDVDPVADDGRPVAVEEPPPVDRADAIDQRRRVGRVRAPVPLARMRSHAFCVPGRLDLGTPAAGR